MRISNVKKSKYLDSYLPANAVIVSLAAGGLSNLKVVEIIETTGATRLLQQLVTMGQDARDMGIQRPERNSKVSLYSKYIAEDGMKDITIEVAYCKVGGQRKGFVIDGLTRIQAALNSGFKGLIIVKIRESEDMESIRRMSFWFDSRDSVRSVSDAVRYVFGKLSTKRVTAIRKINSAVQNILIGCPNEDMDKYAESSPTFKRARLVSYSSLQMVRDFYSDILEWYCQHFTCKGKSDPKGKLLSVGTVTVMVLTRLVYGDEATKTWKSYFTGILTNGQEPMRELRDLILTRDGRGGGQQIQMDDFNRAMYAYLATNHHHGVHLQKYLEGGYQVSVGYIGDKRKNNKASLNKEA